MKLNKQCKWLKKKRNESEKVEGEYQGAFFFFFTLKGYQLRGKKNKYKKIPLVTRPCKEDNRRNIDMGGQFNLV